MSIIRFLKRKPGYILAIIAIIMLIILILITPLILLQPGSGEDEFDDPVSQSTPTITKNVLLHDLAVPVLRFPDNPDPSLCGIPTAWGPTNNQAWLNGTYDGEMVQPTVFLYDSHLRHNVKAQAPHGTEVQIILFQANPVLNYYMVKIVGAPAGQNEGWVPEPFLSFEPLNLSTRRFG